MKEYLGMLVIAWCCWVNWLNCNCVAFLKIFVFSLENVLRRLLKIWWYVSNEVGTFALSVFCYLHWRSMQSSKPEKLMSLFSESGSSCFLQFLLYEHYFLLDNFSRGLLWAYLIYHLNSTIVGESLSCILSKYFFLKIIF